MTFSTTVVSILASVPFSVSVCVERERGLCRYVYVYTYIYMCVFMYMYIHIHIHIHQRDVERIMHLPTCVLDLSTLYEDI